MTDLENQIRDALHDPRWDQPAWPDPMQRVRRTAARQRARLATATLAAVALVVTPLALLPGLISHSSPGKTPGGPTPSQSVRKGSGAVPSWAKRLPGEVAYKCGDSICLMHPGGTARRTLNTASPEWDAAWSPDGRQLAFRGYYAPYHEVDSAIYVVNATGCHPATLVAAANGVNPSWSPTGQQIAFARGGIDVINANGTGLRHLTSDGGDPAWSAANRIAFVRTSKGRSRGQIYTMNADGTGVHPLTHGGPGFAQPSWSADGKSIAFVAFPNSSAPSYSAGVVDVANANGRGIHAVSPSAWWSSSPTWIGGRIVFLVIKGFRTSPSGELPRVSAYIVNSDGTGLRQLYPHLGDALQIAWGSAHLAQSRCS